MRLKTALIFAGFAIVMNAVALAAVAKRPLSHLVVTGVVGCVALGIAAVAIKEE